MVHRGIRAKAAGLRAWVFGSSMPHLVYPENPIESILRPLLGAFLKAPALLAVTDSFLKWRVEICVPVAIKNVEDRHS